MPISRRFFFFGTLALPAVGADKPVVRPNIILLSTESLPAWVLGCYGNKEIYTPNLDRLAQLGTRFQRHFSCAPAPGIGTAALLTGRTPMQLGGAPTPGPADVTIDQVLTAAGYACSTVDPAGAPAAIDRIAAGKPAFLHVAYPAVRAADDGVPQKFRDLYAAARFQTFAPDPPSPHALAGKQIPADLTGGLRKYAAAVSTLDAQAQAVVAKVYERKMQDDTLLVFVSTCGALLGHHGLWGAADSSDPANLYEESVATPLIVSWVGDVPAQAVRPEVVSTYDLLPTLVDIAGATLPGRNLCGRSFRALATGKPLPRKEPWRTTVFAGYNHAEMARIERYKVVLRDQGKGPGDLFDVRTDAGEKTNQYENPEYVSIRNSLTAELNRWRQKYSA